MSLQQPTLLTLLLTLLLLTPTLSKPISFTDDFTSPDWQTPYDVSKSDETVRHITDCRETTNSCLEILIQKGSHYGASIKYKFAEQHDGYEPTELAAKYKIMYGESCGEYRGKAPGFDGTYGEGGWGGQRSDGMNGWSARGGVGKEGDKGLGNGFYVYHAGMTGEYGNGYDWVKEDGEESVMELGTWYNVTQYVKVNDVGEKNGVLAAWVDGEKVLGVTGFEFRKKEELKIWSYWINFYHGGKDVSPNDCYVRVDDLALWEPSPGNF